MFVGGWLKVRLVQLHKPPHIAQGSHLENGKSLGILNRLEMSGKIIQNTGKLWGFQTYVLCYFLMIFK